MAVFVDSDVFISTVCCLVWCKVRTKYHLLTACLIVKSVFTKTPLLLDIYELKRHSLGFWKNQRLVCC